MSKIGRPRNEAPCAVAGCEGRGEIRGWCEPHYMRWYKTSSPVLAPTALTRAPVYERIMRRVVEAPSGCLEWQGATKQFGHGVIGRGGRTAGNTLVHRAVWEHINGPIPDGMCVLHRCDNPPCVNPDHLWIGTRADNNQDMTRKGRHWSAKRKEAAA